jgi:hypothetical protein
MKDFHKYTKIKIVGDEENKDIFKDGEDEIVIEEKLDGANFRVAVIDGAIIFGSRTQQLTSDSGEEVNLDKNFRRCVDFVREKITPFMFDSDGVNENLIFYGENMVKHTLDYDWEKIPPFLGFDIMEVSSGKYLADKNNIFNHAGLPVVPFIKVCKASEIKELTEDLIPISAYPPKSNPTQKCEGIVFKNYSKQIFAKLVRNEFKEKNKDAFGRNPKQSNEEDKDTAEIVWAYCRNPRIDKMIFKLIDEGNKLDMKLMQTLPKRVWNDIVEEEGAEIMNSNWVVDCKVLRKSITKRCLTILKQVITNNALNEVK